ncbi:glycosyltransferase family 4 protein [Flavobacterium sp. SM2513]|uniref:glycosyltransferase family 4 protein n=1 Tax=Flavobacterium sp. SM2513 TaxID=3424766 RepID=UPI003D7F49FC
MKTILYIGNKLSKHGYTPTSIETLGLFFENEGYHLYYASEKKNQLLRFLDMGWSVFRYRKKADYVVIDTYSTFSFWYAFMVSQLCRLFSIKYIPILRGGNLPHRIATHPKLSGMIFNHSYRNVVPSGYLMDAFQKSNFTNLLYIPNTIDLGNYPFLSTRQMDVPKMLWVRSFASLYNPKMAVEVLKTLQVDYPAAELCMVGPDKDGLLEETRIYAKQMKVEVTFTGRLSKKGWINLSKKYNVFINTTSFDNTPVSVIEAMCLGLPVVTTNVGGIPFLLEDYNTALLVDDKAVAQMTLAVKALIEDEVLRSRIVNNGRTYVEGFDWQRVKKQWKDLLV